MNISMLYHVGKKNIKILETLLTECSEEDLLYKKIIPNEQTRKRPLQELFECDLEYLFYKLEFVGLRKLKVAPVLYQLQRPI